MQKNLSREKMAAIYSVARFALSDVQSDKRRNIACRNLREERRITSIDSNIRGVVEVEVDTIVLLGVFSSLAGHTEGSTPAIPIEEWVTLLRYIIFDMSSVGEFTRGSTKNCCVEAIVDVLDKICDYVLGENCSEEYESLWLWLWVAAVTFLHRSLQDFFTFTDAAEIVEQLGADRPQNFCICPILNRSFHSSKVPLVLSNNLIKLISKLAIHSYCKDYILNYAIEMASSLVLRCASALDIMSQFDTSAVVKQLLDSSLQVFESLISLKSQKDGVDNFLFSASNLAEILLGDLHAVFDSRRGISTSQRLCTGGKDALLVDSIFSLWRTVVVATNFLLSPPPKLQALYILGCSFSSDISSASSVAGLEYMKILISISMRSVKSEPLGFGKYLAGTIFPAVSVILSTGKRMDDLILLLLLQLLFLFFSTVEENQRGLFVATVLNPLCKSLQGKSDNSAISLFCGKGLTHLARTCQDSFRENVGLLNPENRAILQGAMAASIRQEQLSQQAGGNQTFIGGSSVSAGAVKKLDFAKFQKPVASVSASST